MIITRVLIALSTINVAVPRADHALSVDLAEVIGLSYNRLAAQLQYRLPRDVVQDSDLFRENGRLSNCD